MPEIEAALPDIETILPEIETTLHEIETALPEIETALPESGVCTVLNRDHPAGDLDRLAGNRDHPD